MDRFDHDLETQGGVTWSAIGAFGYRPAPGVAIALDYQGRIFDGRASQHLIGLHMEFHL